MNCKEPELVSGREGSSSALHGNNVMGPTEIHKVQGIRSWDRASYSDFSARLE
jgi:hypothetical protein